MRSLINTFVLILLCACPAWAQSPDEADFLKGLEKTGKLMEREKWRSAKNHLLSLLEEHQTRNYVSSHRTLIEDRIKTCAFRESHEAPKLKDLISGQLISYSESSGLIKLKYTPETMGDFISDQNKAAGIGSKTASYIHPVIFSGPYTIEIKGKKYPKINTYGFSSIPVVYICMDGEDLYQVNYGSQPVVSGNSTSWYPPTIMHINGKDVVKKEQKNTSPVASGKSFKIKVTVASTKVAAYFNGKLLLKLSKSKSLFGRFGFIDFPFNEVYINGKVEPAWLQGIRDEHEQTARAEYEKQYQPGKHLPAWFLADKGNARPKADAVVFHYMEDLLRPSQVDIFRTAFAYQLEGDYPAGLANLESLEPDELPECVREFLSALFLKAMGRNREGLEHCRKACVLDPILIDARKMEIALLFALGREEEACSVGQTLLNNYPGNVEIFEFQANLLFNRGCLAEAEAAVALASRYGLENEPLKNIGRRLLKARQGPWQNPAEFKSKHYLIYSDIDRKVCYEASRILEESYTSYAFNLQPIRDIDKHKFQVYLFSGEAGYKAFCRDLFEYDASGSAGLYLPELRKLLIWNLPDREAMMQTVRHEGLHQYLHRLMKNPPKWFDEGLAEYYEIARLRRGKWDLGEVHEVDLAILNKNKGKLTPLTDFLFMSNENFSKNPALSYAQSWAFIHYLRHSSRENQAIFDGLFAALQKPGSAREAVEEALMEVDLQALQIDFNHHLDSL